MKLPAGWQDYGAVAAMVGVATGTVSLAWQVTGAIRDKHRFKLECTVGALAHSGEWIVRVKAVNIGKKPGFLAKIAARTYLGTVDIATTDLPVELKPGQAWSMRSPIDPAWRRILELWAEDAAGRRFKLPAREVSTMTRNVHEILTNLRQNET